MRRIDGEKDVNERKVNEESSEPGARKLARKEGARRDVMRAVQRETTSF